MYDRILDEVYLNSHPGKSAHFHDKISQLAVHMTAIPIVLHVFAFLTNIQGVLHGSVLVVVAYVYLHVHACERD